MPSTPELATPKPTPTPFTRIESIDVMRGLTVAFMIMVNNNGQNSLAYLWMNHSPWNGFTPTDFVFPNFLFLVGFSVVLSFNKQSVRNTPRSILLRHIVLRTLLLILLGLVINGFPFFHFSTLRIYGVLQRIAVCYFFASLLELATRRAAYWLALFLICITAYWALLCWVPIPGHGMPGIDFPLLDPNINLAACIDRHIFPHRLFEVTRDPEGLLSDISSFATTLLGMIAGWWFLTRQSISTKLSWMQAAGLLLLALGLIWSQTFPINKKLWTSSYVLYAGGWSILVLSICYFVIDLKRWGIKWLGPIKALGVSAIFAYTFSELLSSAVAVFHVNAQESIQQFVFRGFFEHIGSPAFGSLVYSFAFLLVCWLPTWLLYRRGIVIKL